MSSFIARSYWVADVTASNITRNWIRMFGDCSIIKEWNEYTEDSKGNPIRCLEMVEVELGHCAAVLYGGDSNNGSWTLIELGEDEEASAELIQDEYRQGMCLYCRREQFAGIDPCRCPSESFIIYEDLISKGKKIYGAAKHAFLLRIAKEMRGSEKINNRGINLSKKDIRLAAEMYID